MEIKYTPEQQALSAELRAYYDKLLDDDEVFSFLARHAPTAP